MKKLHRDNLNLITNYLHRHTLFPPNVFSLSYSHPHNIHLLSTDTLPHMSSNHPLFRLKRLLDIYHLIMLPSDKSNTTLILDESVLFDEMRIHLSDDTTYKQLSNVEYVFYSNIQKTAVAEASKFYGINFVNPSPSQRYIYFLPKIHKDLSDWRNTCHPPMRPIISDTNSVTYGLAGYLLSTLQRIEKSISTTINSSICVAYHLHQINKSRMFLQSTTPILLCTIDVESLFTRIPQDKLIHIVNNELKHLISSEEDRNKFIDFLKTIIHFNTFQVGEDFYLQKLGLAMGSRLSGALANIYLGILEKNISQSDKIVLFLRFMDDILMVTYFSDAEMNKFIEDLQIAYQLNLTGSYNRHSVNYLDMTISYSPSSQNFEVHPFSKRKLHFPPPSSIKRRGITTDFNIIKSQILRSWRISSNTRSFSTAVHEYLNYLLTSKYNKSIRRRLLQFLHPVRITTHRWSTEMLLCETCRIITNCSHIDVLKIMNVNGKFISTKQPLHCLSLNIYSVIQHNSHFVLTFMTSIHLFLQSINDTHFCILPIGKLRVHQIRSLLNIHKDLSCDDSCHPPPSDDPFPCYIYDIFRNPRQVYGISTRKKKHKSIMQMFNKYKKISRR
jgi:hypothetical protein